MSDFGLLFLVLLGLFLASAASCSSESDRPLQPPPALDPHSFSRPGQVVVRHLELDLTVDFEQEQLRGKASLHIENLTGTRELSVDTRDLEIERVTLDTDERESPFLKGDSVEHLGRTSQYCDSTGDEAGSHLLSDLAAGSRTAVAGAGADSRGKAPFSTVSVAGGSGSKLDPLSGHSFGAYDLQCPGSGADRSDGSHERLEPHRRERDGPIRIRNAPACSLLSAGHRRWQSGLSVAGQAYRSVRRAGAPGGGGLGTGGHRENDCGSGRAVWALSLGALRPDCPSPQLSLSGEWRTRA